MKKGEFKAKIAEISQAGLRGVLQNIIAQADSLPDGGIKITKGTVTRWKKVLKLSYHKAPPGDKKWADSVASQIVEMMEKIKKKEVKKVNPPDPRVPEIIETFVKYCEDLRGFTPQINYARDTMMIKRTLKTQSKENILDCFDWFLKDKVSDELSITISTALAPGVFNKFLSQR